MAYKSNKAREEHFYHEKYAEYSLKKFSMKCKSLPTRMEINEKISKNDGKAKVHEAMYRSLVVSLLPSSIIHTPDRT